MKVRRGFTLVELLVVVSIIALLISILLPSLTSAREQARAVKCLANLHGQALAIQTYASEHTGILPGPIHPAIKRKLFSFVDGNAEDDRKKSLTWLLRAYFGKSQGDAASEDRRADEVSSCPTSARIVPDAEFEKVAAQQSGCWRERPYSFVANTWGPIGGPGSSVSPEASHTNPPHYFGAWFYCDSEEVRDNRSDVAWRPKNIDRIKRPADEWATADAWYRQVSSAGGRPTPGQVNKRWLGTFAPESSNYLAVIPDRPYHKIRSQRVSSHRRIGLAVLPQITFKGATNMGYFDGHAAPHRGQWRDIGDGGTVNSFWSVFGGTYDNGSFRWFAEEFE